MSFQKSRTQTKSFRKLITIQEWADYIGISKNAVLNNLKKYQLLYEYDSRNIYSVFDFLLFLLKKRRRKIKA